MALGKPILQYDLIEGRFSAQDASLYARPNDIKDLAENIEYLIEHPKELEIMGSFGLNRARQELHWGVEAPKYLKLYDKLLEGIKDN